MLHINDEFSWKQSMQEHPDAWPFKEPVDARDVPDYYEIIKNPIGMINFFTCLVHHKISTKI